MKQLMNMLSKMDKKDLQNAISQADKIMKSGNQNQIIDELKKKMK